MKKAFLSFALLLSSISILHAQFITCPSPFEPTGVSNQGLVAGYVSQAGPYSFWDPAAGTIDTIGGLAPGNGIGGMARFAASGNLLCGTSMGTLGAEMSIYNVTTQQWTPLGSLGFTIDGTYGGGFGIAADGNTVVGLSWADTAGGFGYAHAVAWNQAEGVMDLGSLYDTIQRSTRANAVSGDGNVVVGWQDFNGPWKSAVWRKNPNGGYYPNEYLLIDTLGSSTDEFNQLGECTVMSDDGNWVGGYGDYANLGEPWLWSRATGVVGLGFLPGVGNGYVAGMNATATTAVGWFDGMLWGDPQTPFIWTAANGIADMNDYVHNTLGLSTGAIHIMTANGISANGQYIYGYGMDTTNFNFVTYRVSAVSTAGVSEVNELTNVKVYPNPSAGSVQLIFSDDQTNTVVTLCDVAGHVLRTLMANGHTLMIERGDLQSGIYFLQLKDAQQHSVVRKIIYK